MPDFLIRNLPKAVHELMKEAARRNQRSLNKEIIARLEASLFANRLPPEEFLRRVAELQKRQKGPITLEEIDAAKRFGRP